MFKIGKVKFAKNKTVIIAEAGVNHNGNLDLAMDSCTFGYYWDACCNLRSSYGHGLISRGDGSQQDPYDDQKQYKSLVYLYQTTNVHSHQTILESREGKGNLYLQHHSSS